MSSTVQRRRAVDQAVEDELEHFDFAAELGRPLLRGQTLQGRRERERRGISEADRKAMNTTGRTKQMNMKVRPATHAEFIARAHAEGIMPTELFEKIWDLYKATEGLD
jgi:hypothetical protein